MKKISLFILLFILSYTAINSCDNSLDPIDRETGIFAIYGFLDLKQESNYIRVSDLHAPFTKRATVVLDAIVSLHNLNAGSTTILESEIREYEGVYLHNFVYHGDVIPDNEYRLTVERSDGVLVSMSTVAPTMPEPLIEPLHENCFEPVELKMEPMNGGTIVLRFGFGPGEDDTWGPRQVFNGNDGQTDGEFTFRFIPHEQVILAAHIVNPDWRCGDFLRRGILYLSYIHYAPGFYEQVAPDTFDVFESTRKFGALYYDTLAIPVDTSRVCPPDC